MNKCIVKRQGGGVMRISDYWLLEVVQQCQWILKETDSNHTQNIRSKKILERVRKKYEVSDEFRKKVATQNKKNQLIIAEENLILNATGNNKFFVLYYHKNPKSREGKLLIDLTSGN